MSRRNIGQAGKILADSGYQGLMKMYSQAQTPRKSSKLKPLTLEDKAYNHALSKERSKVENIFAKVKNVLKYFQQPIEIDANGLDYE